MGVSNGSMEGNTVVMDCLAMTGLEVRSKNAASAIFFALSGAIPSFSNKGANKP